MLNMFELFKKIGPSEVKATYPKARRDETFVDDYNGKRIVDAFRWLEIPGKDEVRDFALSQDNLARTYFQRCSRKEEFRTKIQNLYHYPKYSCPTILGQVQCHLKNDGLQSQSVLYVKEHPNADFKLLVDPATISADGCVSIVNYATNGKTVAYSLSNRGSDWLTINFKGIDGTIHPDLLVGVNLSRICWNTDTPIGIFYCRFMNDGKLDGTETTPNVNHKLFFHTLGTMQSDDMLIAEFPEHPNALLGAKISSCGNYLLITLRNQPNQTGLIYLATLAYIFRDDEDLLPSQLTMVPLTRGFNHDYDYIFNEGTNFYFRTNRSASNYCISRVDVNNLNTWINVVPEHAQDVLEWSCSVGGGKVLNCYQYDCTHRLDLFRLSDGTLIKTFQFTQANITEYRSTAMEFHCKVESFFIPERIFRINLVDKVTGWQAKVHKKSVVKGVNPNDYVVNQVLFRSKDQAKIPMFIMHKKDLEIGHGNTPCWLYCYGGYGVSTLPTYSPARMAFMKYHNGIVAVCNIRGGGEHGTRWHDAGRMLKKQNCLNDLQCAAAFLIDQRYTRASKLVVEGHSNGGLVVAASINQHPDLFAAGIVNRGILDMLRYDQFTIGKLWQYEFGTSEDPKECDNLLTYSPLHNIQRPEGYDARVPVQFPSILVLTSAHDDRVVPLHSFKYIANLQYTLGPNPEQSNPLLMRYDKDTGHDRARKPTFRQLEEMTDVLCFITLALDL